MINKLVNLRSETPVHPFWQKNHSVTTYSCEQTDACLLTQPEYSCHSNTEKVKITAGRTGCLRKVLLSNYTDRQIYGTEEIWIKR